jgi:tetratricopeptide (TPR) repeat protein
VSFGLGFSFGRYSGYRSSYYRTYYDPFYSYPYYSYGTSFGYVPVTTAYYGASYPVYSAPGTPVNIDVNNYGYGSDNYGYSSPGEYGYSDESSYGVVPPSSSQPQATATHRQLAEAAFYRGEYDLARREVIQAMLATPDDAELEMFYAFVHFAVDEYATATSAIRRAISADPSLIIQPLDVASYYGNAADFEGQFYRLERTIAANPYDAELFFLAGYVQYAAGNADLAYEILQRAEARAPNDVQVLMTRDASKRAAAIQSASRNDAERQQGTNATGTNDSTLYIGPDGERSIPEVLPTYPVGSE